MTPRLVTAGLLLLVVVLASWAGTAAAAVEGVDHDLTIMFDPRDGRLEGSDVIGIRGAGEAGFGLAPGLLVTRLEIDGRDLPVRRRGGRWAVELPGSGDHTLVVDYRGILAAPPAAGQGAGTTDLYVTAEGSFLAAGWYPEFDVPAFTYRLTVEVPAPQKAVSLGRLVAEEADGDPFSAVFASEFESDRILLMSGPWEVEELEHGAILLRTWFHPRIASLAAGYLDTTAGYIDYYQERIGDYPYSAFHIVSGPLPVGWGFAGLTYMGTRVLGLPFIRHTSLGHEVLHNWWGNGVRVDYGGGNWSEGLTTFMADYAYARLKGPEAALEMRLGWLRNHAALPAERDRPAIEFVAKTHDAAQVIGYDKVAFFFHMLERRLGARAFDAGIGLFWRRHRFSVAGWSDLRRAFEEASGSGLGKVFDQWLRRAGAPRLYLGAVEVAAAGDGHGISLVLSQDAPAYDLLVPVTITTAEGEESFTVPLAGLKETFELRTAARPTGLAVDPGFDIFRRLEKSETPPILRDVTLSGDTVALILAGDEAERMAARALAQALMDQPPRFAEARPGAVPAAPLLVIGESGLVAGFLEAAGLPPIPPALAGRGTARVWTGRHGDSLPLLVVAADDAPALEALLRPLPHYGRRGYLVFEAGKAMEFGTWPVSSGPLAVALD